MGGAEKKWLFTLFSLAFLSLLIFLSSIYNFSSTSPHKPFSSTPLHTLTSPPSFAYYISGSLGDVDRIFRLLLAVYHPRNVYLLHINAGGSDDERRKLSGLVRSVSVMRAFGNVEVIGKADANTYMGASNIAAILRGGAILLKMDRGWDWFVTLSALDYPLITQDGMIIDLLPIFLLFGIRVVFYLYVCVKLFNFLVLLKLRGLLYCLVC